LGKARRILQNGSIYSQHCWQLCSVKSAFKIANELIEEGSLMMRIRAIRLRFGQMLQAELLTESKGWDNGICSAGERLFTLSTHISIHALSAALMDAG